MATLSEIKLNPEKRILTLSYDDGKTYELSAEYLRVFSPSAEVRGHGKGQEVLQLGKELVTITSIDPVGNYAIRLVYSDGHDSGIYAWEYLEELAINQAENWQEYLDRVAEAGKTRVKFKDAAL
jgi:DUF971 family protein